ncbi:MAG TPA: DUF1549 domain-containing protein [Pirellulales bacterium]|jgi:hypothetical protein|nr:DUF1549 domain-containing protein [Pirellulales bacterium]
MLRTTRLGFVIRLVVGVSFIGAAAQSKASVAPKQAAVQTDQLLRADLATAQSSASKSDGDQSAKPADTAATKPANAAGDETFLHRASMDLIGQPPTPAEITSFVLDPSPDKRAKMVDRLLAKSEFGENWARYWRDVIMYRRSEDRSLLASPALTQYLTEQFNKNIPWDQIARSFITATGDVRENGATGIIAAQFGQAPEVTAEVSRIFMGIEIQCANCHNHPTDRWKRTQFHELAAFFPRLAMRPVNNAQPGQRSFAVVGVDRQGGPGPKNPNLPRGDLEHYMPDLKSPSSKGTLMQPVFFLTGQKLPEGTPDAERRATIAKWITSKQDPWFAKAFVNRIWSELVGEGFYEPVDDMGPDRECTAPKTLDYLANQFVLHDYDVKWLYRTIMDTAAYQRDSRSRHLPGETPFVANCPQRLRADELFTALMSAIGVQDDPVAKQGGQGAAKRYQPRDMRGLFNAMFGYDPSVRRDEVVGSIPQALVLMNSPQLARAIDGKRTDTALGELLSNTKDDEAVTTELYLRCLAREPKPTEMKICPDHVKQTANRPEAFENILWALVNSTEFLHRK